MSDHLPFKADEERRPLVSIFVDLVESTANTRDLGLEQRQELLQVFKTCCEESITKYGGKIFQVLGDGVVAYFGHPTVYEDDAERAVSAGVDICSSVKNIDSPIDKPLEVRIGIDTSDALVDENIKTYGTVIGDAPILAARIQSIATPGVVFISDRTKRLLGKNFKCTSIGEKKLKGFDEPEEIWIVKDIADTELRYAARLGTSKLKIVNRESELRILQDKWQIACDGKGQAVQLYGEAGIGKSALVSAFSEQIRKPDFARINLQCNYNQSGSGFFPLITFLKRVSGIELTDTDIQKFDKLKALVSGLSFDTELPLKVLAYLLSIEQPEYAPVEALTPEGVKREIQNTLIDVVIQISRQNPLMLVVEDLHWIDPSSDELLDLLVARIDSAPIFLVCTYRSETTTRWLGNTSTTALRVAKLNEKHSGMIVRNTFQSQNLPDEVERRIVDRTGGIPLFLEEMSRMIVRRSQQNSNASLESFLSKLPTTLKGLLRARIDNVPETREVIRICAAIGGSFRPDLLQEITQTPSHKISGFLDKLVEEQLLVKATGDVDETYAFRHALIQEVAYESLLSGQARKLHKLIAETLISKFPGLASESPELVAQHYYKADNLTEACGFWIKAAKAAKRTSSSVEAVSYIDAALSANDRIQDAGTLDRELELRELACIPLEHTSWGSRRIVENLERLRTLREDKGDGGKLLDILHGQSGHHLILGEVSKAKTLANEIITKFGKDNELAHLLGKRLIAFCQFMLGEFDYAIENFSRVIALSNVVARETAREYYEADAALISQSMICWAHALQGNEHAFRKEEHSLKAMTEIAETPWDRVFSEVILGSAYASLGHADACVGLIENSKKLAEEHGYTYWHGWAEIIEGWATALLKDPIEGIKIIERGTHRYQSTGSKQTLSFAKVLLAEAYLAEGMHDEVRALIEELEESRRKEEVHYVDRLTSRLIKQLNK